METDSRKALENLLPDEWVVRPLTPDYGIGGGLDYLADFGVLALAKK